MKNTLSQIIDFVVSRTAIFLVSFVWLRYYLPSVWSALGLALLITLLAVILLNKIGGIRQQKISIKTAEQKHKKQVLNQLLFNTNEQNISLIEQILDKEGFGHYRTDYGLIAFDTDRTRLILFGFYFTDTPLCRQDIIERTKTCYALNTTECVIMCLSAQKAIDDFASVVPDIRVRIFDADKTYTVLKQAQIFPEIVRKIDTVAKMPLKSLLDYAFNKRRAKNYFFSGLIILAVSLLTFYTLYYVISSTVLFLISAFSYFNGTFNKKDRGGSLI